MFNAGIRGQFRDHRIDAIISPAFGLPALPHGASPDVFQAAGYVVCQNITGMPAGVVSTTRVRASEEDQRPQARDKSRQTAWQADHGSANLPVGVQVSALPWQDEMVLRVMAAIELAAHGRDDYPLKRLAGD